MKDPATESTGLRAYKVKRNFRQTAEPKPRRAKRHASRLLFVIQKHAASRLHYDFRLEMDGVLKSWAVPKGLPITRGERRLAVHVEDHPFDYARFEGTIPEGNYGAGTVMVWDIGEYEVKGVEPRQALKEGKIHLTLTGKKLQGEWTLVRLKARDAEDKDNWLIFKSGTDLKPFPAKREDQSALSGRSMAQISGANDAQWQSNRAVRSVKPSAAAKKKESTGKTKIKPDSSLPSAKAAFVPPMKCRLRPEPPVGENWIYEIKFDGFRALAVKTAGEVELFSRAHKSLTARFPEVAAALEDLPCEEAAIDGEVVALDDSGRSSFQQLQMSQMPGESRDRLCYYAFDLLQQDGKDFRNLSLDARKAQLEKLVGKKNGVIRFSSSIEGDGVRLLAEVRRRGLEGIIAKDRHSKYESGQRSGSWTKIKCDNQQEFVIGGYTAPQGTRGFFGAVLVGYFQDKQLLFASKVGTGFNHKLLEHLFREFQKRRRTDCPFANLPERRTGRWGQGLTAGEMKKCTWVQPDLICQIRFTEWTRDGHLRHPAFLGLRDDKAAKEVIREKTTE